MPSENAASTVLTVDDNEMLRYSISRMLLEAGFQVIEASSGREALEKANSLPDLITLDVNLPDISGFQVCRQLKTNPHTSHIPVLHVSGTFVDPEHRVQGLRGGADAYLAEPLDRAELIATVEALLRIKRSERQALQQVEVADSAREQARQVNAQLEARVCERTAELEAKSEEIRELSNHLMKVQDEERRKIARELHDSTAQLLAVLNMNLGRLRSAGGLAPSTQQIIADSADITAELTSHIRTVAYLLHPPLLDEVGLASALAWYIEGFTERSHIEVKLAVSENFDRLNPDMEIALFRVIQECLTNVHKHSHSGSASVELSREAGRVVLTVQDSGTSFAGPGSGKPSITPGMGLLGMRQRVRQLNGQLTVSFEPSGTRIVAVIPLEKGSAANDAAASQGESAASA
jgi:signal transduction histidine kinase